MLDKEFDQIVRERLDGHPSAVPDDMWQRIMRKEKDRKALIFWRWYIIGPAFIAIMATCLLIRHFEIDAPTRDAEKTVRQSVTQEGEKDGGRAERSKKVGERPERERKERERSQRRKKDGERLVNLETKERSAAKDVGENPLMKQTGGPWSYARLPNAADLKSRRYPKAGPLVVPDKKDKKDSAKERSLQVDVSVSPVVPYTHLREGLSHAAGVRVSVPIRHGFSLIAGLQYARINVKQNKDSGLNGTPGHFTTIDLPVLIGYTTKMWHANFTVKTGILVNLRSLPGNGIDSFNSAGKRTGLGLYLGLDLTQKLSSRIALFAEPWFRYPLSGNNRGAFTKAQTAPTAGLSVGLKYEFKRAGQRK